MKIQAVKVWSFSLKLTRKLKLAEQMHDRREGLLVQLIDTEGYSGWGEISPLPGFSSETRNKALYQLKDVLSKILGMELPVPDVNAPALAKISLPSCFLAAFSLGSSVRFGLDTAWLMLLSKEQDKTIASILTLKPLKSISVNALLSGSSEEINSQVNECLELGYRSYKLKIGRQTVKDDIATVRAVRVQIGDAQLRLDCNRSWRVEEMLSFWKEIHDCKIEYVEEPLNESFDYETCALNMQDENAMPLALDESLTVMSHEDILSFPNLKALIIKPTILGFDKARSLAILAKENSLKAVVSSSFESSVGLSALAQLAASFNETDVPVGLDTLNWMSEDLLTVPMRIDNGKILISELPDIQNSLRHDLLTLESHDGN